jgi:hypothetical protein
MVIDDFEADLLTLSQAWEPRSQHFRAMHENIISARVRVYESKVPLWIE